MASRSSPSKPCVFTPADASLFSFFSGGHASVLIHYDRSYATQTERYPGLAVHELLLATLMVELVRTQWLQRQLAAYRFRALHPMFDIHSFSRHPQQADSNTVELWVQDAQGRHAMETTTATLRP
jgi:3-methylfumaryl-CoA hydratase